MIRADATTLTLSPKKSLLAHLPDTEFERKHAIEIAGALGISPRSADEKLRDLVENNLLMKVKAGCYLKIAC